MFCQEGASPAISGKVCSHLDTRRGVRPWRPLSWGNGYLMTGLLQLGPECALCVPSGSALQLAVNGQGDWLNGCLVNNRSL